MFVIRCFSSGNYVRSTFSVYSISILYFKSVDDVFDFIRFELPCSFFDFSAYGVVLCLVSQSFENSLVECDFHFGLCHYYVNYHQV